MKWRNYLQYVWYCMHPDWEYLVGPCCKTFVREFPWIFHPSLGKFPQTKYSQLGKIPSQTTHFSGRYASPSNKGCTPRKTWSSNKSSKTSHYFYSILTQTPWYTMGEMPRDVINIGKYHRTCARQSAPRHLIGSTPAQFSTSINPRPENLKTIQVKRSTQIC